MKSFILSGLDVMQQDRLQLAGITFFDWSDGVVINEVDYAKALEILNATGTSAPTEYQDVLRVTLQYHPPALSQIVHKESEISSLTEAQTDSVHAQARARYITACRSRMQTAIDAAKAAYIAQYKKLPPSTISFGTLSRQFFVAAESAEEATLRKRWSEEFERVSQVAGVRTVRVTRGALLLYTDTIYATSYLDNSRHVLGKFLIVIRTDMQGDPIRWFNQTRQVDAIRPNMHAPYVLESGLPILSDIVETMIQLVSQFEFSAVAELAIQFLQNTEPDEPGKHIASWPILQS